MLTLVVAITVVNRIYANYAMRGVRRIGGPFIGNGMGSTTTDSLGFSRAHENWVTKWWMITRISMRANSLPGHILGPPPNGANVNGLGPAPSKRDGSNFSGSRKYLGFRWVECVEDIICVCKTKNAMYGSTDNLNEWMKCQEHWWKSLCDNVGVRQRLSVQA